MNFKKFHESKNLFDKSKKTDTSRVVYTTGEIDALYGVFVSDFTPIEPNTTYTLNIVSNISSKTGHLFALYDENKNFVNTGTHEATSATVYTFTTPSNVAYIRFNGNMTSVDSTMLNVGSTPLPYEPYGNTWIDISYYQHKTATDTLTLPAVIYANDTTATVGLKGNMEQNGTPTPDNPIMPQGTGERTGNLFDENYPNISGTIRYIPLYVGEGSFTLSTTTPYDSNVANVFLLSGNVSTGASTPGNGAWLNHNVTTQSVDGYVTIAYRHYRGTTSPANCQTMLNAGRTALPYEPYGYKLTISSANTTTPVYIGEVESTRKIKKLVLTGGQHDGYIGITPRGIIYITPLRTLKNVGDAYCTHYKYVNQNQGIDMPYNSFTTRGGDNTSLWFKTEYATIADFKDYLADQYANGTPVTVWYVLATEETGIVNEPLRKIDTYADTVSGITVPVTAGENTLSVDTTLQPSEVTATYKGWHPVSAVHERINGAWT